MMIKGTTQAKATGHVLSRLSAGAKGIIKKTIPFPFCKGIVFAKFYRFLDKSQWYSSDELKDWKQRRLRAIILHAYQNVKYYRRIFDDSGLKPDDIVTEHDLDSLPILTKEDIRKHYDDLLAKNWKDFHPLLQHTSGSTGEPLSYYIDRDLYALVNAIIWRHYAWCGIKPNDRVAVFRGTLIDEFGSPRARYYKVAGNEIHFSTFEMKKETMCQYVEVLNHEKPSLIRGYPASLKILAEFIKEHDLKVHAPKAIHTSSEVVLAEQRAIVTEVFQAPFFDFYGHGERTISAGECSNHRGLHINAEQGCVHLVKTAETKNMDGIYNIVGTSLWNFSMPFLRYDTEDLAELSANGQCKCGRSLPLIQRVLGRQADIIEGINGVKVSPSSAVHFWKYKVADHLVDVSYAQIIQEGKSDFLVRLVGKKEGSNEDIIKERLKALLGDVSVRYEYLSEVPTGQKWRFTVRMT